VKTLLAASVANLPFAHELSCMQRLHISNL